MPLRDHLRTKHPSSAVYCSLSSSSSSCTPTPPFPEETATSPDRRTGQETPHEASDTGFNPPAPALWKRLELVALYARAHPDAVYDTLGKSSAWTAVLPVSDPGPPVPVSFAVHPLSCPNAPGVPLVDLPLTSPSLTRSKRLAYHHTGLVPHQHHQHHRASSIRYFRFDTRECGWIGKTDIDLDPSECEHLPGFPFWGGTLSLPLALGAARSRQGRLLSDPVRLIPLPYAWAMVSLVRVRSPYTWAKTPPNSPLDLKLRSARMRMNQVDVLARPKNHRTTASSSTYRRSSSFLVVPRRSPRRSVPSLVVTVYVHSLSFYIQYTSFIHWSPRVRWTWEDLEPHAHELQSALSDSTTGAHREGVPGLAGPRRGPLFKCYPALSNIFTTFEPLCHKRQSERRTRHPSFAFIHLRVQRRRLRKTCPSRARDTLSEAAKATSSPPKQSQETGLRQRKPSSLRTYPSSTQGQASEFSRRKSSTPGPIVVNDAIVELTAVHARETNAKTKSKPRVPRSRDALRTSNVSTQVSFGHATLCLVDGATNSEQGEHERHAPQWDSDPRSFEDFLDEYEDLCSKYELPEEERITSLTRYAPDSNVRAFWQLLAKDNNVSSSWNTYRKVLIENTPGAGEERRYLKVDLEKLVSETQSKPMRTRSQLNEYWKKFFVISEYLVANRRLAIEDSSSAFLQGLPSPLSRRVRDQLRREDPTRHPDDPCSLQDVFKVTNFVLTAPVDDSEDDLDDPKPRTRRNAIPPASPSPTTPVSHPHIPETSSTAEPSPNVAGMLTQAVTALTRIIEAFMVRINANSCQGFKTNWGTSPTPRRCTPPPRYDSHRLETCVACQSPSHFARRCTKLQEYMNQGRCIRNLGGKVCYPDGIVVTPRSYPGHNILERLDSWQAHQRLRTQNTGSQHLPETYTDSSTTAEPATSSVAQTHLQDVSEVRCQPSSSTEPSAPQNTSTPAPCPPSRPLPTEVQKSKSSLYHNEIFAANTLLDVNNSDSDLEDISALETMLQERRRQLDLARSKLCSQASQGTHQLMKDEERKPTEAPFDPRFISSAHYVSSSQLRIDGSSGT
ncbi:hypothetical protein NMY22_g2113 [Coprinellus aureogranulatus]|nr:hypothetical protein NMY22_g2113 [Coprinellus aureogranulatus]